MTIGMTSIKRPIWVVAGSFSSAIVIRELLEKSGYGAISVSMTPYMFENMSVDILLVQSELPAANLVRIVPHLEKLSDERVRIGLVRETATEVPTNSEALFNYSPSTFRRVFEAVEEPAQE